ncbi:unnamed protein product [Orchesella dallaii]|uniref:Uncharacterized protein n=1 Tax=Orchesella dallaii TaxID=48710 RepID=A0ABP1QZL8_9HEXA
MDSNTDVPLTEEQVNELSTAELQVMWLKAVTEEVFRINKQELREFALVNSRKRKRDSSPDPALYSVAEQISVSTRVLSERICNFGFHPVDELSIVLKKSQQRLLPLPFYEKLHDMWSPSMALLTAPGEDEPQKYMITGNFTFSREEIEEYEKAETEILLRIWKLSEGEDHTDFIPEGLKLKVNDNVVSVPTSAEAMNIDDYVDLTNGGNLIEGTWTFNETPIDYAFEVVMVRKRTIGELFRAVKAEDVPTESETKQLRTSSKYSIMQKRLYSRCRAVTCTECPSFNLEEFLRSQEKKRYGQFKCITCIATIKFEDLRMCE